MANGERELTLVFGTEGAAVVSNAIRQIGQEAAKTARTAEGLGESSRRSGLSMSDFGTKLLLLPGALVNLGRIMSGVANTLRQFTVGIIDAGGAVSDTFAGFERLSRAGVDTTRTLNVLREATQGQVANTELMRIAIGALGGDSRITAEQLGLLTSAIFATSKATGEDFRPSLEALRRALATGQTSRLAAIEGFEGVGQAIERAREAAQAAGQDFGRSQQFTVGLAAAVRAAEQQLGRFGGTSDNAGDVLQRLRVRAQNFFDELKAGIVESTALQNAIGGLGGVVQRIGEVFGISGVDARSFGQSVGDVASQVVQRVGDIAVSVARTVRDFTGGLDEMVATARVTVSAISGFFEGLSEGLRENVLPAINLVKDALAAVGNFIGDRIGDLIEFFASNEEAQRLQRDLIEREIERRQALQRLGGEEAQAQLNVGFRIEDVEAAAEVLAARFGTSLLPALREGVRRLPISDILTMGN